MIRAVLEAERTAGALRRDLNVMQEKLSRDAVLTGKFIRQRKASRSSTWSR